MTQWQGLPSQEVIRPLPVLTDPQDTALFHHEIRKRFGPTEPRSGCWDFSDDGLLLAPDSWRVDALSFQGGFPRGLSGLKVRLKALLAWVFHRRERPGLPVGTRALVVTDEFSNGFFHWVAESLPKLWWVRDRLGTVVLILPSFAGRFRYMPESLAVWPELRFLVVPPKTRWVLEDAIVLPALAPTGNYRPDFVAGLALVWRGRLGVRAPHRRLYVSRAKAPWRKIRNEEDVWAVLEARGFERVFLEDVDFEAQVRLLAETAVLVSNHGAGLTNLLFMVAGTKVVEIRLKDDRSNNCYFSLAAAVQVEYLYLLADPAEGAGDSHTADLIVDPSALDRILEDLG